MALSVDVSNSVMVTREGSNISLSCNVSGKAYLGQELVVWMFSLFHHH